MKYLRISLICLISLLTIVLFLIPHSAYVDHRVENDYSKLVDERHIVIKLSGEETVNMIDNKGTFVLMMGFSPCPWCQALMPHYNDVAKQNNLKNIYYLDILKMRNNLDDIDRPYYEYLYDKCQKEGGLDIEMNRISAPTIIVVKEGRIVDYHIGTVDSHVITSGHLPEMTKEQISELHTILTRLFSKIK